MQQTIVRLPRQLSRRALATRTFSTAPARHYSSPFGSGPAPPRLPKEEQELFERLQRQSTGAFSTPRAEAAPTPATPSSPSPSDIRSRINQSPDSTTATAAPTRVQINQSPDSQVDIKVEGGGRIPEGEEVHPNMRRGAPPEFMGDTNPKTGEVGGPKNEPLRWGSAGDWSFNGRVTDF